MSFLTSVTEDALIEYSGTESFRLMSGWLSPINEAGVLKNSLHPLILRVNMLFKWSPTNLTPLTHFNFKKLVYVPDTFPVL